MKKIILALVVICLLFGGYHLVKEYKRLESLYCGPSTLMTTINQTHNPLVTFWSLLVLKHYPENMCFIGDSKGIALQQVNNLGYTFYVGQIDYQNVPAISDDIKNQITKIIVNTKFPKNILKTIPIVFVNSLAIKPGQYIADPNNVKRLVDTNVFGPDFLNEGGKYATYDNGMSVIYLNKIILDKGLLVENLTHELGHAIGSRLSEQDLKKYYQLRNIPKNTPEFGTSWNTSPAEDFAEVYRSIFTGSSVRTIYGNVNSQTKDFVINIPTKLNN